MNDRRKMIESTVTNKMMESKDPFASLEAMASGQMGPEIQQVAAALVEAMSAANPDDFSSPEFVQQLVTAISALEGGDVEPIMAVIEMLKSPPPAAGGAPAPSAPEPSSEPETEM